MTNKLLATGWTVLFFASLGSFAVAAVNHVWTIAAVQIFVCIGTGAMAIVRWIDLDRMGPTK